MFRHGVALPIHWHERYIGAGWPVAGRFVSPPSLNRTVPMRIALAFRAFFSALFSADGARRIAQALNRGPSADFSTAAGHQPVESPRATVSSRPTSSASIRSEAMTLLSVLQHEARLLDLVNESLDAYSDQQIGSAARNVLRDTSKSLDRIFGIRPVAEQTEGEIIDIPDRGSPIRWRVLGDTSARSGIVAHAGWMATRNELPQWTGNREDAMILAPVEVESKSKP
jgi:hypothetical protein